MSIKVKRLPKSSKSEYKLKKPGRNGTNDPK